MDESLELKLTDVVFTDSMLDNNVAAAQQVEKITEFLRPMLGRYLTVKGKGMCAAPALTCLYNATAQLEQAVVHMKGPAQVQPVGAHLPPRRMN
jgi:hypothetical protein